MVLATIDGSFITTPLPFNQMRVFAVPKSIAISPEIQLIMLDNDFLFIYKYICKISTINLMIINQIPWFIFLNGI